LAAAASVYGLVVAWTFSRYGLAVASILSRYYGGDGVSA
jgi:hypothetical protein